MNTTITETIDQAALRAQWETAKQALPAIALSAHQALRALDREELATRKLAGVDQTNAFDAYILCEALDHIGKALEAWVYVSARLWASCEQGEADEGIRTLHQCSVAQYHRVLLWHIQVQNEVYTFCNRHQLLLRFAIITEACNVARNEGQA